MHRPPDEPWNLDVPALVAALDELPFRSAPFGLALLDAATP
jgi:hypothetical protein